MPERLTEGVARVAARPIVPSPRRSNGSSIGSLATRGHLSCGRNRSSDSVLNCPNDARMSAKTHLKERGRRSSSEKVTKRLTSTARS